MSSRDFDDRIRDARQELRDWAIDNPDEVERDEPHDQIHEIADSSVPIYNADLLRAAAEDNNLALTEPELGPAFDGKATPINIIAANCYEKLTEELWEEWHDIKEEFEARREEWDEAEAEMEAEEAARDGE